MSKRVLSTLLLFSLFLSLFSITTQAATPSQDDVNKIVNGVVKKTKEIMTASKGTLTYDANGGSGAPEKQTFIMGQAIKISTVKPTRNGYTFVCWKTEKNQKLYPGNTVKCNNSLTIYAQWKGISFSLDSTLVKGDQCFLSAKTSGVSSSVTWKSSNTSVASISKSNGKVILTAKKAGQAYISVTSSDGYSFSKIVTVKAAETWQTGNYYGTSKIKLNKNAGDAYIKIYNYNTKGKLTKIDLGVQLLDEMGNVLYKGNIKSGSSLRLDNDHSTYIVKISYNTYGGFSGVFNSLENKCGSWAVKCEKNCYIA
ncbi:MAG TPA: hypothetical protein DDY98_00940 [Ruminococcaceae bacterium]|nr:hypothetical protein [Oscillospiraceae bacterium]